MKTILIGTLTKADDALNKESYTSQHIEITIQEYDLNTGEPREVQVFPATIFNKKIVELKAQDFLGKKVAVTCFLKSRKNTKEDKMFYNIALNATGLKIVA